MSKTDFLVTYGKEFEESLKKLKASTEKLEKAYEDMSDEDSDILAAEIFKEIDKTYDDEIVTAIDHVMWKLIDKDDPLFIIDAIDYLWEEADRNYYQNGTEHQMVIYAIKDIIDSINSHLS